MNKWNPSRLFPAVLILAASAGNVFANGFALPDQDAFATARGEAFVATADNPSAIYYNPAGITQLQGNNLRGGAYGIYLDPTFTPPGGGATYHNSQDWAAVPQLFYTFTPGQKPLSFGLGVYAPFGGNIDWPQNTGFRSVAVSGSLKYLTINPMVALKVSPSLSLGAGVMVNYGKISMDQGLTVLSPRGVNFFNFDGDGWGAGYNLGLLWKPHDMFSFGAALRSSAKINFQGNTSFELNPGAYNSPAQRDASAEFTFPLTAVLGASYRPTPKWNFEFDANCTDWSSFDTVNIKQSPPAVNPPFNQDIPVNLGWQASWMYEFGVTRYFDNGWHVSAGYAFNENSVPNSYYTPLAADMNRHFFSIGTGFSGKMFDFDVAYQFGYSPGHSANGSMSSTPIITGTSGETADGKYKFVSHALIVSAGLRF